MFRTTLVLEWFFDILLLLRLHFLSRCSMELPTSWRMLPFTSELKWREGSKQTVKKRLSAPRTALSTENSRLVWDKVQLFSTCLHYLDLFVGGSMETGLPLVLAAAIIKMVEQFRSAAFMRLFTYIFFPIETVYLIFSHYGLRLLILNVTSLQFHTYKWP